MGLNPLYLQLKAKGLNLMQSATERYIYFSSGPDKVADIFLHKFDKFCSEFIGSTIVHSELSDASTSGDMEIIHDENLPQSFYKKLFEYIISSKPSVTIDFYINKKTNTSCAIHDIYLDAEIKGMYMTEFFTQSNFFNLTSYQIHCLNSSNLSEMNNFWIN